MQETTPSLSTQPDVPRIQNKWAPQGLIEWCALICLQAGWLNGLLATTNTFYGVMTFPAGLVYLHVHFSTLFIGTILMTRRKWFAVPFVLLSVFCIFADWGLHPFGHRTQKSDVAIMSWNIQGLDTLTNPKDTCATDFLKSWTDDAQRPILLFQEVPKSAVKTIEQSVNVQCTWTSYFNHSKIGLLVCADQSWTFRFENHRSLETGTSYGFQQVEVSNPTRKQRFNILNVHMPSLALIARQQGMSMRSTIEGTLKANPSPKHYLKLLRRQHEAHQESMESIVDLIKKLKDPTVVGGDFNMPPTASIHDYLLDIGMQDAHTQAGWGWDFTTRRFGVLFNRIDFIYASQQMTWGYQTTVHTEITCSDHFPVTGMLSTEL